MPNYGSKDLVITLTDSGIVERDITQYVRSINGVEIEAIIEDSHGFGKSWGESIWGGFSKMAPVVLGFLYNDAANTPDSLWSRGATRTLKVTYGSTKYTSVSVLMQKYNRNPQPEKATQGQMTLMPSGTVTEN